MNDSHDDGLKTPDEARHSREVFTRAVLAVPAPRLRTSKPRPGDDVRTEPEAIVSRATEYLAIKGLLHERLLDELDKRKLLSAREEQLTAAVSEFVAQVLDTEKLPLNDAERARLADDLIEETLGVGPLALLLADPAVTDILVNGPEQVYVERFGRLELTETRFRNADHLVRIIQRIAAHVGRRIDEASPMVDARLPDGSRVNATLPPITIDGPTLGIRRFGRARLRREDLLRLGMLSENMSLFLEHAVKARKNILISGGTGAGKSTFLGAVAESIPANERIVTIEDAAELILDQTHVVRMETRPPNVEGSGRIAARELVINSLRMRPDRIIVGEVRGGEALDMMQAMNTGHDGSLTTVHANGPRDALARLETMVLMGGLDLPSRAIREQIVSAIQLVVHVRRYEDGVRRVEMRQREASRARLGPSPAAEAESPGPAGAPAARFARRRYILPWLLGVLLAAAAHWLFGLAMLFTCALATTVGLLGGLLDRMWLERREALIEQQLADAIDLMVGALYAGASVPGALESAWREARQPFRSQLEEMIGRLRYGDQPLSVFTGLAERVPLENFRLFSAALAVHWEVGGSLDRARQYNPKLTQCSHRLALLYERNGRFADARKEYDQALASRPKDADLLNDYGYFQLERGDLAEAEKTLRRAVELDAKLGRAWGNLGLTLGYQGRYDEAYAAFEKAAGPAEAHSNLGAILLQQQQPEAARQHLLQALAINAELEQPRRMLEWMEKK